MAGRRTGVITLVLTAAVPAVFGCPAVGAVERSCLAADGHTVVSVEGRIDVHGAAPGGGFGYHFPWARLMLDQPIAVQIPGEPDCQQADGFNLNIREIDQFRGRQANEVLRLTGSLDGFRLSVTAICRPGPTGCQPLRHTN